MGTHNAKTYKKSAKTYKNIFWGRICDKMAGGVQILTIHVIITSTNCSIIHIIDILGVIIMASARNQVIAGDYNGSPVVKGLLGVRIGNKDVNKATVDSYELMTEEKMKSGASAIFRGAVGAAILGPVGLLAGLSAKNKEIKTVAIQWSDGKKSLIEVNGPIYKAIMQELF